jgi:hypothetical protein
MQARVARLHAYFHTNLLCFLDGLGVEKFGIFLPFGSFFPLWGNPDAG